MAKKLESTLKNMTLSLCLICASMSAALGYVYSVTKDPILQAEQKKINDAIRVVVPEFDNNPVEEVYKIEDIEMYPAKKDGQLVGTAVKTYSNKGFGGYISIMVGIQPDGTIYNTSVMIQKETPGLGTKMKETRFTDQFKGKNKSSFIFKVKKDGGNIDAITAATISSRAFCDAVNRAVDACMKNCVDSVSGPTNKEKEVYHE